MHIPSPQDSWLIIGSGRTGSKFIVNVLRRTYELHGIKLTYVAPNNKLVDIIKPMSIVHTHSPNDLSLVHSTTKVIISTRDIIDSSLSYCIQPHIGEWHLYPHWPKHLDKLTTITPFHLDPELLINYVNQAKIYQSTLSEYNTSTIPHIDYSEFMQLTTTDIAQMVGRRLGIDLLSNSDKLPIKNPGSPKDWILNWDEIIEVCHQLRGL